MGGIGNAVGDSHQRPAAHAGHRHSDEEGVTESYDGGAATLLLGPSATSHRPNLGGHGPPSGGAHETHSSSSSSSSNSSSSSSRRNSACGACGYCASILSQLRGMLRQRMVQSESARALIPCAAIIIAYWCVYLFRYPLFLLEDEDFSQSTLLGVGVKTWISSCAVFALGIAKFPAIKVLSALQPENRLRFLIGSYLLGALSFTAFLPLDAPVLAAVGAFVGGFPTACIYTALLAYFEGRQNTELYISALNCVVVFGSAAARAVARALQSIVPVLAMPLVLVLLAIPPYTACVFVLDCIPPPTARDQQTQAVRKPMPAAQRNRFLRSYWPGLLFVNLAYMAAVALRTYRDFFVSDIYTPLLSRQPTPTDYLAADIPGGVIATMLLLVLGRIRKNKRALKFCLALMVTGGAIAMAATAAYLRRDVTGQAFIILIGCATFVSIVPFSGSLYDRMLAATATEGTSVFLVLISDLFGYVGAIAVLLYRPFSPEGADYRGFFIKACVITGLACLLGGVGAVVYFARRLKRGAYRRLEQRDETDGHHDDPAAASGLEETSL